MTVPSARDDSSERTEPRRESLFRALFDSMDEAFCHCEVVLDGSGTPVDYRFLETNAVFTTMTGLHDPVGRTARELVEGLDPAWVSRLAQVGLGRRTMRFEGESCTPGRWFDMFAVPAEPPGSFVLVFRDQTVRHRAEQALRESEERFRGLADQLPFLVWQHDAGGRQVWANEEYCRYLGLSREELRPDRWAEVLHPGDAPGYLSALAAAVEERRPVHVQTRVRRADGEYRWLETWASPQRGPDGEYLGHLGIGADVTGHREAESALRSAAAAEAYRARLLATLRGTADPVAVQARAAEVLGRHLGASRVHYAEVDPTAEYGIVHTDYHPGVVSVAGTHRFDDYGPLVMNQFRAGRVVVVTDVAADARLTEAERAATAALGGVGAYVMVPLVKRGEAWRCSSSTTPSRTTTPRRS